jgi:predicted RNA-binding Zn-ribbon protein involved in translation (DUF1610 family)
MTDRTRSVKRYCPQCGDAVLRIPRRAVDRLISIVRPVFRYQCTSLECGWQGNLPRQPELRDPGLSPLTTPTGTQ